MGRATIHVPATDNREAIFEDGLSDALAMGYGTSFARTLSDVNDCVTVKLESGLVRFIRHDALTQTVTIGR